MRLGARSSCGVRERRLQGQAACDGRRRRLVVCLFCAIERAELFCVVFIECRRRSAPVRRTRLPVFPSRLASGVKRARCSRSERQRASKNDAPRRAAADLLVHHPAKSLQPGFQLKRVIISNVADDHYNDLF